MAAMKRLSRGGAVDGEMAEPALLPPFDQQPDQAGSHEAEGDAVAAIAIGREQARMAGHPPDQGQAVLGLTEGAGPGVIESEPCLRNQRVQARLQGLRFLGAERLAPVGIVEILVLAAEDDAAIRSRTAVAIILRSLPDESGPDQSACGACGTVAIAQLEATRCRSSLTISGMA